MSSGDVLSHISQCLQASLDPSQNKQAELALRQEEKKPGFAVSLLQIVASDNYNSTVRLASALFFKNFLKRNWTDDEGNHRLPAEEVATIKREIIGLMISVPSNIQAQLGDCIGIIADSDFWKRWETLVDDLISRLTQNNHVANNGVLQVAHSIFKRWRPLYRSDDLFTEINHVLGKFDKTFMNLLRATDEQIQQNISNKPLLRELLSTLNLLIQLLYDLSCQDLPPTFEDNLGYLADLMGRYLLFQDAELNGADDDDAGPLQFIKSGILETLSLYATKYEDAFAGYIGNNVGTTWNLLTTTGLATRYDILVSKALQFLTSVTRLKEHAASFNDENVLKQVMEGVIIPNVALRESDIELFEDEPIEYIRRDLEGGDNYTRRRSATDFLRSLMAQFEDLVTSVVLKYVDHYVSQAAASGGDDEKWKAKDTAVYLYSAITALGVSTTREGVKRVNPRTNVIDFFQNHIATDLVTPADNPILQVDAIKYLYTFRTQLSQEQWGQAFPLLVQRLASPNYVVHTYAAIAVERILALTNEAGIPVVDRDAVKPLAKDLVQHLFHLIEQNQSPDRSILATKYQENEFLMRCIMRVLIVIREGLVPLTDLLLEHLIKITEIISINPSNPRFYYYHFEALGALVRFAAPSHPEKLESALWTPFVAVIQNDIFDFIPYVFQLFAALLEARSTALPEYYRALIPGVMKLDYWTTRGNVPALARLLYAMIARGSSEFVSSGQIEQVLSIFQYLVQTKANETSAMEIIEGVITHFPVSAMENYYPAILQLLLTRLQSGKSETFNARFVRFYHLISAKADQGLGADFFMQILEKIQPGLYTQVYLTIILPGTPKLVRPLDRKLAVVSLTKTLTESQAFAITYAKKGWGFTCDRLLELLINPPVIAAHDDVIAENDVEDMAFGVGFTPLVTIRKVPVDYFPDVVNVKTWVGEWLKTADQRQGGKISSYVQERLTEQSRQALLVYMQG